MSKIQYIKMRNFMLENKVGINSRHDLFIWAKKIAEEEFRKITCDMVRTNKGNSTEYQIDNHQVRITFDYYFTGVWVTAPDGKKGSDGGPKDFCNPDYKGPKIE